LTRIFAEFKSQLPVN